MHTRILPRYGLIAICLLLVGSACGDDPARPQPVTFVVEVSGERFNVRATRPDAIADLEARRLSGQRGVVLGTLASGDGGFNSPWSWHLDPATVEVADAAIELCDGRPSMVEADTNYWIGTVGQFCPWGALVESRTN
jgi:hypothetical protein